jgi:hypothetical protein
MIGGEVKRWFNVQVMKAGRTVIVPQLAYTQWHAVELVYTKLRETQPDRSKYSTKKKRR